MPPQHPLRSHRRTVQAKAVPSGANDKDFASQLAKAQAAQESSLDPLSKDRGDWKVIRRRSTVFCGAIDLNQIDLERLRDSHPVDASTSRVL